MTHRRKEQPARSQFGCVAYGYEVMADYALDTNIAARAAFFDVNQPVVAPLFFFYRKLQALAIQGWAGVR